MLLYVRNGLLLLLLCFQYTLLKGQNAKPFDPKTGIDSRFDPCVATVYGNVPLLEHTRAEHLIDVEQRFRKGDLPLNDTTEFQLYLVGLAYFCGHPLMASHKRAVQIWSSLIKVGDTMPLYALAIDSARHHDWSEAERLARAFICATPQPRTAWQMVSRSQQQLRAVIENLPPELRKKLSEAGEHNCGQGYFPPP